MKRFVFRLERLQRLRELRRRESRATLARAIGQEHDAARIRELAESQLIESNALQLPGELAGDPMAWRQLEAWRDGRRARVAEARERQQAAGDEVSAATQRHAVDSREHRVLEQLRERRRQRWQLEVESEEREFLDEVHLLRLVGRRSNEED